jgi:hypothetical protein
LQLVQHDRSGWRQPLRARNGDTGIHILCHKGCEEGFRAVLGAVLAGRERERCAGPDSCVKAWSAALQRVVAVGILLPT